MQQSENFSSRDVSKLETQCRNKNILFSLLCGNTSRFRRPPPLEICVSRMSSIKYLRVILITMKYVWHGHNWTNLYEWGDSKLNSAQPELHTSPPDIYPCCIYSKYFDGNLNYTISTFYLWVRFWWGVPDAINRDLEWRRKLQLGWEEIRRRNI